MHVLTHTHTLNRHRSACIHTSCYISLHVHIHCVQQLDDADDSSRFKVPIDLHIGDETITEPLYEVDVYQTKPFSFRVVRTSSRTVM